MADSGSLTRQSTPHIERTSFDPIEPPPTITVWFCPACGKRLASGYNLDPARKRCSAKWHLAAAVGGRYKLEEIIR